MARKRPGNLKSLARDMSKMGDDPTSFQKAPVIGENPYARPGRYNSGNEQQSDLAPSARPSPGRAAPSRPAAARPKAAPARPKPKPGPTYPKPTEPTYPIQPTDNPVIPGTGPLMPQFDPMGSPTGPMAPPASGSSLGDPYLPPGPGLGQGPPLTGPGSDRNAVGPTQLGGMGSLPAGQSAAMGLAQLLGLGGGGAPPAPDVSGITPSVAYPPPMGPTQGPPPAPGVGQPPPLTGPGSDRALPPPGILEQGGDWLKKNIPPLRF